ncbi:SpoIIE family protein phosphatase [Kitasatospora sp. NPDC056138]|uniref:SpoIIE family protein phosphatase n=1 Tax=Kitasatospora sp. NPDC056138 TaxID=3345724 RepID=UPI0035DFF8E7
MKESVTAFEESPNDPFAVRRAATAVLDRSARLTGWSERARELLGYRPEEVLGRPAAELLVDPGDAELITAVADACRQGSGWFGVLPVRHRDGSRMLLGVRARCVTRAGPSCEWFLVGAPAQEVVQWETDRAILDGLFRRSPIGFASHSPDLRVLRVNRAIARIGGLPSTEFARGHRIADFLVAEDARTIEARLRRVLETGDPMIFTEQPCRLRRDPSHERFVAVSAFRLEDPAGSVLGVAQLIEDVTERHRAQRRLALLNEASDRIGTTLNVTTTARELSKVAVPSLADCITVDLLESVVRGGEPAQFAVGPVIRVAAMTVAPEAEQLLFPVGDSIRFSPDTPQARCLSELRPIIEREFGASLSSTFADARWSQRLRELGVRSLMVVPLVARGVVLGLISLWRTRQTELFDPDDLTLAVEFAARAAVCIDNARRYTQQHQAALALQHSMLPSTLPGHPAVEVAHRYLPAGSVTGVGGDWFDVIPLSGARVALIVGDVVGHGIHAAATMGRLRTAVQTLADLDLEPDEVLTHLDDLVSRLADEQEATSAPGLPQENLIGAACLYAVYDPVTRRCSLARAGHPPPIVVTPEGAASLVDVPAGPPLGLGGLPFETAELVLAEGSLLALYTDGLIEAGDRNVDHNLAQLLRTLSTGRSSLEVTATAAITTLVAPPLSDDTTLLLARTRALAADQVATWQLAAEPRAAALARGFVTKQLNAWGLEEMTFTTELIATELVTNAYRYSSGPIELRLIVDRTLMCEVSDASTTTPHLRRARTTDEGGRGLFLVAQLTQRWGTRYTHQGKTVWTEQLLNRLDL